jgi:hypothetical protein
VGRKANANIWVSAILLVGAGFIAAGASVPNEQTMSLGFFLMLSATAVLLGLNWPKPRPTNLVSMDAFRARHPRPRV